MDILPHLLLPLTGPEEFPEDEMEKLPPDLQHMDDKKERESDPDIRNMLLEALLQVCQCMYFFMVNKKGNVALKAETNFSGNGGLKKCWHLNFQ